MDMFFMQAVYKQLEARVKEKGLNASIIQKGVLRSDIALNSGQGSYQFAINSTSTIPAARASEYRLNNNNSFCALYYGLFLINEVPNNAGQAALQTYPNATVFPTVATYVNTADLEAVWNSYLNIKVGDIVFGNRLDLNQCRVVKTTLQTSATNYSEKWNEDGYIAMVPTLTYDGSQDNVVTLNFPTWQGQLIQYASGNSQIYAVLRHLGFTITNASSLGQLNYE